MTLTIKESNTALLPRRRKLTIRSLEKDHPEQMGILLCLADSERCFWVYNPNVVFSTDGKETSIHISGILRQYEMDFGDPFQISIS